MKTLEKTNRSYTNVETGSYFNLYKDQADNFHLIAPKSADLMESAEGTEVNGFYLCAHCGATIRLNTGKEIYLNPGEFYNLKEGEAITHRKFLGSKRFIKI